MKVHSMADTVFAVRNSCGGGGGGGGGAGIGWSPLNSMG